MTREDIVKSPKTVGISLRDPTVSFALHTVLSEIAHVITIDGFSLLTRSFKLCSETPDVIVSDLDECLLDRVPFDKSYAEETGAEIVAFIPIHIAALYFFRLQRSKIPTCLWREGLTPVKKAVQLLCSGEPSPPESTIGAENLNYLRYGTKDAVIAKTLPLQLRTLAPRMDFDHRILAAETGQTTFEVQDLLECIEKFFEVGRQIDAIKAAEQRGITQLRIQGDPNPLEKKILEDSAMAAIAKWLARRSSDS